MTYVVIMAARNEEKIISHAISNLMKQTLKAAQIYIVDDGSSDQTFPIAQNFAEKNDNITIIKRRDHGTGRLGTYLMSDVYNTAFQRAIKRNDWDWLIVVAADTYLPPNYAADIIKKMIAYNYGVAGGFTTSVQMNDDYCTGSGRVIRRLLLEITNGFPRTYGWEEGCLFCANMLNLRVGHFKDIIFTQRPAFAKKGKRGYIGWGRGMRDNGYHIIHLFYVSFNAIRKERDIRKALHFIVGYFAQPHPKGYPWVDFQLQNSTKRVKQSLFSKIKRILP